jgi:hypothetical protein
MVNISREQNSEDNLKLLAAQRHLYTNAKNLQIWNFIIPISLSVIAPIIVYYLPDFRNLLTIIGAIWFGIFFIINYLSINKIRSAATIQEQFDTNLFELPWNKIRVGNKVSPEIINDANRAFKGNKKDLENWYSVPEDMPCPLNILHCQRSNLVWDWRLRRNYAVSIIIIVIIPIIISIIVTIIKNLTFTEFMLSLLIPSLSSITKGINIVADNIKIANEKENLEKKLNDLWESGVKDPKTVTIETCRQIQDKIFDFRCNPLLIPDNWYNWLKKNYQEDLEATTKEMVKQIKKIQP